MLSEYSCDAGEVTIIAGSVQGQSGFQDGMGTSALFSNPQDITMMNGNLFITDTGNFGIRVVTPAGTKLVLRLVLFFSTYSLAKINY